MRDFNQQDHNLIASLIADPDFKKLQTWNQHVNTFQLNSMQEMNHSRMIQWVLDPREAHSLGTWPLSYLLNACWVLAMDQPENERQEFFQDNTINPLYISQMNLQNMVSFVEYSTQDNGRIDLLLVCQDEKLAIIIENKIGAGETKGQLNNYTDWGAQNLSGYRKLYLHMDYYEKWDGAEGNQWLKISYDWLIELLDQSKDMPSVPARVSSMINDYYLELTGEEQDKDEYFKQVKPAANKLVKKHGAALAVMASKGLMSITDQEYLRDIQGDLGSNARLLNLYHQNVPAMDLLLQWDRYIEVDDYLTNNIDNIETGYSKNHISINFDGWKKFQITYDGTWSLYLYFQANKPNKDHLEGADLTLDLKLQFEKSNFNTDYCGLVETIWKRCTGQICNIGNIAKSKSFRLERDIELDRHEILRLANKYIDLIESVVKSN